MSANSWIKNVTWSGTEWLWQPTQGRETPSYARSSSKSLVCSLVVICHSTWQSHFSSRVCLVRKLLTIQPGLSKLTTHWLRTNLNNLLQTRLSIWQDTQLMSSHQWFHLSSRKHTLLNPSAPGTSTRSGRSSLTTTLELLDALMSTCASKPRRPQHSLWATNNWFWILSLRSRTCSASCLMLRLLRAHWLIRWLPKLLPKVIPHQATKLTSLRQRLAACVPADPCIQRLTKSWLIHRCVNTCTSGVSQATQPMNL